MNPQLDHLAGRLTNWLAALGILSPGWWPSLQTTSSFAAECIPILSALWLVIQIGRFISGLFRGARERRGNDHD